jgi:ABC-type nitrate/sulfonate/bicarbonate transport system permease component
MKLREILGLVLAAIAWHLIAKDGQINKSVLPKIDKL